MNRDRIALVAAVGALGGSLAAHGATWRRLREARRWIARDRESRVEQFDRLKRERGELRGELKLARDRIGKLERQLERAPRRARGREVEIIREFGCTKGASFLTRESAEAYLHRTKSRGMHAYDCAVCRTSDGEVIFHVGHIRRGDRKSRALRRES